MTRPDRDEADRTDGDRTGGDRIELHGLRARGRHGVLPEERALGQEFGVDVTLHVDTRAAAASDDLARTVDYGSLAQRLVAVVSGEPVDLIETLAERLAAVALDSAGVHAVDVRVHKPQAPITVPFDDVVVAVHRRATVTRGPSGPSGVRPGPAVAVVLALGANLGDPVSTLAEAVEALAAAPGMHVHAVSPLSRTEPVGGPEQPAYLNAVVVGTTTRTPEEVLALAQDVEAAAGRERLVRWGPRTLDVDVIQYAGVRRADPELTLPHPRAGERAFVLVPWAQADPDAVLVSETGDLRLVGELAGRAADRDGLTAGPAWPAGSRAAERSGSVGAT